MSERFKLAVVRNEVTKLVRSNARDVLDVPEAIPFLLGDRLDRSAYQDLKVRLLSLGSLSQTNSLEASFSLGTCPSGYCHHLL